MGENYGGRTRNESTRMDQVVPRSRSHLSIQISICDHCGEPACCAGNIGRARQFILYGLKRVTASISSAISISAATV